ncbi:MAG TPA: mechanosensitive ion channel [Vicinamibacterales bacterium]|nr:mechanosensitive ion channel [Vicinamibacterales bacterium]
MDMGISAELTEQLKQIDFVQIGLTVLWAVMALVIIQRLLGFLADRFTGHVRLYLLGAVPVMRLIIFTLTLIFLIPRIVEPTFENLVALLGAAGLAIGFALRDLVSSVIGGIVSLFEIPYRPGDWVEIDGVYGEVKSIRMRVVKMVTPDDTAVLVPNLKIWTHLIKNGTDGSANLMCVAEFYLHPRHDAARVHQTLRDVALTSAYLRLEQPVAVVVLERPWGTQYRVKAYPIDPRDQFRFLTDITIRGKQALTGLGVEFAVAPTSLPAA